MSFLDRGCMMSRYTDLLWREAVYGPDLVTEYDLSHEKGNENLQD